MTVRLASRVLSSIALLAVASSVNAQNLPAEGPLSISFTATQIPPAKPMPIGAGKEFVVLNMAMTATNDTGNPVLHNMGGRCQFARTINTATKAIEQHGFCTYADNDGNQIFEQCDFLPGAPNNCKLTGGTGKFEGLEASIVITAAPVKSNYDGVLQIVGQKKGSYKMVKTN